MRRLRIAFWLVVLFVLWTSPCAAEGKRPTRALDAPKKFGLFDEMLWDEKASLLNRLEASGLEFVGVEDVLDDLNRKARSRGGHTRLFRDSAKKARETYRFEAGFSWNYGDSETTDWYPQGITGSGDANGSGVVADRRVVLVSWYSRRHPEKGVRISFVDVTNPHRVRYRHVLLVEPVEQEGIIGFRSVKSHAGGIVLYGDYLYVAATEWGVRVFDMTRIFRTMGDASMKKMGMEEGKPYAFNYRYALPMVGHYRPFFRGEMRYSFLSLDRTRVPHTLWVGEYDAQHSDGYAARFPLVATTGRLAVTDAGHVNSTQTLRLNRKKTQGFVQAYDTYFLDHTYASDPYRFHVQSESSYASHKAPYGLEDLYFDPTQDRLWFLTEHPKGRLVYCLRPFLGAEVARGERSRPIGRR